MKHGLEEALFGRRRFVASARVAVMRVRAMRRSDGMFSAATAALQELRDGGDATLLSGSEGSESGALSGVESFGVERRTITGA